MRIKAGIKTAKYSTSLWNSDMPVMNFNVISV